MLDIYQAMNGSLRRLGAIRRYSSIPCGRPENVAEHIGFAAIYAYLIALDLEDREYDVNMGGLLEKIVVHDLDESMSGDIMRGFKYTNDHILAAIQATARSNMNDMVEEFGDPVAGWVFNEWDKNRLKYEDEEHGKHFIYRMAGPPQVISEK